MSKKVMSKRITGALFLSALIAFSVNSFAGLVYSHSVDLISDIYEHPDDTNYSFVIHVDYEVHDIGGGQYEARFQLGHMGAAVPGPGWAFISLGK